MPDYNIYIHAVGGGGEGYNPTMPWSARDGGAAGGGGGAAPTTSQTSGGDFGSASSSVLRTTLRALQFANSPDSIVGAAINSVAKVIPWVAVAVAVIKLGETITENVLDFGAIESGDYKYQKIWQDAKAGLSAVLNPVSTMVQTFKQQKQWARENTKLKAQRDLLGDSVINSYSNRGV